MMTTKRNLNTGTYVYDLPEMAALVKDVWIGESLKDDGFTKSNTSLNVNDEIKQIDDKLDIEEKKFEGYLPKNNLAGIIIIFIFRCIYACFKRAFNCGYYLGSFVCKRRVVRMGLGVIFGMFTNVVLALIIYGFYLIYMFIFTMYFEGGDRAQEVTSENIQHMIAALNKIAEYAKLTHNKGLITATERTLADVLHTVSDN